MLNGLNTKIGECDICRHKENEYSLTINVENTMTQLTSHDNVANFVIYYMTKNDMYDLARNIIEIANKVESVPVCK